MDGNRVVLNQFLVEVFNNILSMEEKRLDEKTGGELSVKEMHVIDAVCQMEHKRKNTAKMIASLLRVTPATLSVAVKVLERKGYVQRFPNEQDKRSVYIVPTLKGQEANKAHAQFHQEMVEQVIDCLEEDELRVFAKALYKVNAFFIKQERKAKNDD